jgi:Zn-dependent protease
MTIREIHTKTGSLSNYMLFIMLVFLWYFLDNIYTSMKPVTPESSIRSFLEWGYELVIVPLLLAGVFGGIHEQQRTQGSSSVGGFFNGVKLYAWRIMGANLLALVVLLIAAMVISVSGGPQQPDLQYNNLLKYMNIPYSAITLFWFAAIAVERKIFQGLLHAMKTLLFNPFALAVGIVWGAFRFADTAILDILNEQTFLALNGMRAGILAVVRILATVYALAIYKQAWSDVLAVPSDKPAASDDGLIKASLGFAFASFLPFLHLVALVLGLVAMKREKRFVTGSAIACCVGGFFTLFYSLLIAGRLVAGAASSSVSTYTFLVDADADLKPYVELLEQGSSQEVQQQLEQNAANRPGHHWAFDSALALAKYHAHDLKGALEDFRIAAEKKPEQSEFYYYYGIALLDNHQEKMAAEQFRSAILHEPKFEDAKRYLNLINTAYHPPPIISAMFFMIILLMLFTLHEYGHAFAAWKLGDDTAKNLGRLTLNPIPHLEIFGSILLPAMLLWQQSTVVFGWAKPVLVKPENFKDPHKDHMLVAFAGPAVNMIVSMICLVILGCIMLFVRLLWPETLSLNFAAPFSPVSLVGPPFARWLVVIVIFLKQLFYTSLLLGCFNLLPIPPLDGSWILSGVLSQGLRELFEKTRGFGFVIFLLLILTHVLDYFLIIPISLGWGGLAILASAMGLG